MSTSTISFKLDGVELQAQRPREVAIAVGQHHQAIGHVVGLAPGLHHEGVVDRHACHLDAAAAEVVEMFHEAGQVLFRARGGERAGHREEHDPPAIEQVVGVDGLDAIADTLQGDLGDAVAVFDAHGVAFDRGKRHSLGRRGRIHVNTAATAPPVGIRAGGGENDGGCLPLPSLEIAPTAAIVSAPGAGPRVRPTSKWRGAREPATPH